MYLRTTQRTNKDGSIARYVQLAHNLWDARAGCAKAKVLYNFGRAEQVDRAALERLVGSIRRVLGPDAELQGQASDAGDLRYLGSRAWGGVWALDECQGTPRFPQLGDTQIPAPCLPGVSVAWGRRCPGFLLSARDSSREPLRCGQARTARLASAPWPPARRGQ